MSWDVEDYRTVAAIMAGWAPEASLWPAAWPLPGGGTAPGWLGVAEDNGLLAGVGDEGPRPSNDRARPVGFASWVLDYEGEPDGFMDEEADPERRGVVIIAIYSQLRTGFGRILRVRTSLRQAFTDADTDAMTFFPNEGRPQRVGERGEWYVHLMTVRFVGA